MVDAALLNRLFREYYLGHGQGGKHTLQRNLLQLFNFLVLAGNISAIASWARRLGLNP